jgi:DNA-binding GntR family transcriptional regulator
MPKHRRSSTTADATRESPRRDAHPMRPVVRSDAVTPRADLARGWQGRRAHDYVRQELLRGRFRPSEPLSVEGLAAEIGVSRQPLMEAMRRLSEEGLVEIIPQVGCRVAVHTPAEIADFFRLFATVEGLLARLAAERHEPRELRRLRLVSAEIGVLRSPKVKAAERSEGYRTINREFHSLIHDMARAPQIAQLAQSFWDRSDFHLTSSSSLRLFAERLEQAHDEHESLLGFISARKAERAAAQMTNHILSFSARLHEALTSERMHKDSAA